MHIKPSQTETERGWGRGVGGKSERRGGGGGGRKAAVYLSSNKLLCHAAITNVFFALDFTFLPFPNVMIMTMKISAVSSKSMEGVQTNDGIRDHMVTLLPTVTGLALFCIDSVFACKRTDWWTDRHKQKDRERDREGGGEIMMMIPFT